MLKHTLTLLPQKYAVCRPDPNGPIPYWALLGDDFVSLTRTNSELSVACLQENVPEDIQAERGWRCAKVEGPFDFNQRWCDYTTMTPQQAQGMVGSRPSTPMTISTL